MPPPRRIKHFGTLHLTRKKNSGECCRSILNRAFFFCKESRTEVLVSEVEMPPKLRPETPGPLPCNGAFLEEKHPSKTGERVPQ